MDQELKKDVSNRVNRLGYNEFLLAYSKAESKDSNTIVELVEQFRKPFSEGRVTNIGSMVAANPETWAKIAEEADTAAKRDLLKNSAELSELERLERAANEARRLAEQKSRELQTYWNEFNSIPAKIEAINARITEIAHEVQSLDQAKIEANIKSLYRSRLLDGVRTDPFAEMQLAALLATHQLRKQVLDEVAEQVETQLAELKARQRVLSKRLGQGK